MKKRRGNNEGCVYKRADGRWEAVLSLGYGDGKRRRKSIYGRTRAEVSEKLTALMHTKDRGLPIPVSGTSLDRYLLRWLDHVRPSLRPKTYALFKSICRVHIRPEIGHYRLERISPDLVQDMLNRKLESGLSPQTVRHIRTVLNLALKKALRWDLVVRNAAALTDGPKVERAPIHPLTIEEVQRLFASIEGDRLGSLIIVAVTLGLRRGELLGLSWNDIDLDQRKLHVRRALQRVDGRLQFLPLKTKQSARTISLPAITVSALKRHSVQQKEERLQMGPDWTGSPDNLVFTSLAGTPLEPHNIGRRFEQILTKARIGHHRFNDLRHTAATLLFHDGASVKQVQALLGHSRAATTLDVYVHHAPAAMDDTASRMDAMLNVHSDSSPAADAVT